MRQNNARGRHVYGAHFASVSREDVRELGPAEPDPTWHSNISLKKDHFCPFERERAEPVRRPEMPAACKSSEGMFCSEMPNMHFVMSDAGAHSSFCCKQYACQHL